MMAQKRSTIPLDAAHVVVCREDEAAQHLKEGLVQQPDAAAVPERAAQVVVHHGREERGIVAVQVEIRAPKRRVLRRRAQEAERAVPHLRADGAAEHVSREAAVPAPLPAEGLAAVERVFQIDFTIFKDEHNFFS